MKKGLLCHDPLHFRHHTTINTTITCLLPSPKSPYSSFLLWTGDKLHTETATNSTPRHGMTSTFRATSPVSAPWKVFRLMWVIIVTLLSFCRDWTALQLSANEILTPVGSDSGTAPHIMKYLLPMNETGALRGIEFPVLNFICILSVHVQLLFTTYIYKKKTKSPEKTTTYEYKYVMKLHMKILRVLLHLPPIYL